MRQFLVAGQWLILALALFVSTSCDRRVWIYTDPYGKMLAKNPDFKGGNNGAVYFGTRMEELDSMEYKNSDGVNQWKTHSYLVRLPDGREGWVSDENIIPESKFTEEFVREVKRKKRKIDPECDTYLNKYVGTYATDTGKQFDICVTKGIPIEPNSMSIFYDIPNGVYRLERSADLVTMYWNNKKAVTIQLLKDGEILYLNGDKKEKFVKDPSAKRIPNDLRGVWKNVEKANPKSHKARKYYMELNLCDIPIKAKQMDLGRVWEEESDTFVYRNLYNEVRVRFKLLDDWMDFDGKGFEKHPCPDKE